MQNLTLRSLASANHFMVFASSAIVTGIISYFLNRFSLRNAHIIYQEVIATITLAVFTISMVLPFVGKYRGHLLPFNLVMSYLWLTSFIFSTQDWAGGRCAYNGPSTGKCGLKKTVIAFNFLALFFLLCNVVVEGLLWRASRVATNIPARKQRPVSGTTVDSAPGGANNV